MQGSKQGATSATAWGCFLVIRPCLSANGIPPSSPTAPSAPPFAERRTRFSTRYDERTTPVDLPTLPIMPTDIARLLLFLGLTLTLGGCVEREHDLLGVATARVQAPPDTTGWGNTLQHLHGVWLARDYAQRLHAQRSIIAADALADPVLGILNVNTALLEGDSIPVITLHTAQGEPTRGAMYLKMDTTNQRGRVLLDSRQRVISGLSARAAVDFLDLSNSRYLVLHHIAEGMVQRESYLRVSEAASPRVYGYDPAWGVSRHMESLLHGDYAVYNPAGDPLPWSLSLHPGGDLGHPYWDRYRWMALEGRDALVFQRMAATEGSAPRELRFEIAMPSPDEIALYGWERERKRRVLRYRLRRKPTVAVPSS